MSGVMASCGTADLPAVVPGVSRRAGGSGGSPGRPRPRRPDPAADAPPTAFEPTSRVTPDALVLAVGPTADLDAVGRRVLAEAAEPVSVAELAARLGADYVRVHALVGALRASGHLAVTASMDTARDLHLMRRVLDGLRDYS